jgi:hypothetical protein
VGWLRATRTAEKAPILIGTVRRRADDLDEIAVRPERKSRYAEKGLLKPTANGLDYSDPHRDLHWAGDQRLPAGRVLI